MVLLYLVGILSSNWWPRPFLPVAATGRAGAVAAEVIGDAARAAGHERGVGMVLFFLLFMASWVRAAVVIGFQALLALVGAATGRCHPGGLCRSWRRC